MTQWLYLCNHESLNQICVFLLEENSFASSSSGASSEWRSQGALHPRLGFLLQPGVYALSSVSPTEMLIFLVVQHSLQLC